MIVLAVAALSVLVALEDARSRCIRNSFCAAIAALGILFQAARIGAPALVGLCAFHLAEKTASPLAVLATSAAVLLFGCALELLWRHVHGASGMGMGDVKYVAAWTALLGPAIAIPFALACLAGAGAALARKQERFAFGPYLSAAFSCALLLLACGIL